MEVKERIINLLAEKFGCNSFDINEGSRFVEDLECDSLDVVEVIMGIEKEFGITIADEEANNIFTVGDLIKKVENIRMGR